MTSPRLRFTFPLADRKPKLRNFRSWKAMDLLRPILKHSDDFHGFA
jgi:hypothetical protein